MSAIVFFSVVAGFIGLGLIEALIDSRREKHAAANQSQVQVTGNATGEIRN